MNTVNDTTVDRSFHETILRNMAEGVALTGIDDGIIIYANPKFVNIFGYEVGELEGRME